MFDKKNQPAVFASRGLKSNKYILKKC